MSHDSVLQICMSTLTSSSPAVSAITWLESQAGHPSPTQKLFLNLLLVLVLLWGIWQVRRGVWCFHTLPECLRSYRNSGFIFRKVSSLQVYLFVFTWTRQALLAQQLNTTLSHPWTRPLTLKGATSWPCALTPAWYIHSYLEPIIL